MNSFTEITSRQIPAMNITVSHYRHEKTGAEHFHIAADNPENVFMVALRTVPQDSMGVAHILEHTALCGSKRFPVRDPFFLMIRRSLNTFMNAFTSSDWTAYPFASQNKKDFQNLMEVYLDAVFFSLLSPLDFAQEGHRLEFTTMDDATTPLQYKGVVFNEMKGALSSPVHKLWDNLSKHIYPTSTYHHISGGDPEQIPNLTHQQLVAFYQKHYHPSNAIFFTFGDIPAADHQKNFEHWALQHFSKRDDKIRVHDEQRLYAPVAVETSYPCTPSEAKGEKTHIILGWLLGHSSNYKEWLQAQLLAHVLLDNSSSPLLNALETTPLASAPSPLCGLEDSNNEMLFICGVEGSNPDHANAIQSLVMNVLRDVARNGVPKEHVEAVLHQFELSQREVGGNGQPYGLTLCLRLISAAIHDGDPVSVLDMEPALAQLRQDCEDPNFIKSLAKKMLVDNPHRVRLCLKPDAKMSDREISAEKRKLEKIRKSLNEAQKKAIIEQSQTLADRQSRHDDDAILPKVGLSDIPKQVPTMVGTTQKLSQTPVHFYSPGTNGLVYQDIVYRLPEIPEHLLPLLPYYTSCLTELGVGNKDYMQTQAWQARICGGVQARTSLRNQLSDANQIQSLYIFSGKALNRHYADLNELIFSTLQHVRFDEHTRIRELLSQIKADLNQNITGHGHSLAMTAACRGFNRLAYLTQHWHGLETITHVNQLDKKLNENKGTEKLAEQFRELHELVTRDLQSVLVVSEPGTQANFLEHLSKAWPTTKPVENSSQFNPAYHSDPVKEVWTTGTQVNFSAKAFPTVTMGHPDAAALTVLGGFLRNGYLHRVIREQGGAYGGGAGQDSSIAAFRFYSYRDPRLTETLDDFDRSLEWLYSNAHTPQQLEEAILGVISSIDKPSSPAGEAKKAFYDDYFGRTVAVRQKFREQVLAVTISDLQQVAKKYLLPEKANIAVIAAPTSAKEMKDLGFVVREIL